eukprot:TRINITY_DN14087_c0_g1_i1.p1 TRINITY_DN14087_c0_g1~~TRINITY_DN14087_c0_g1_i1.p1  ORF type:complete len:175 (-),score=22.64 TRINITY_DN14087_c0_g1_i1:57-581(-)
MYKITLAFLALLFTLYIHSTNGQSFIDYCPADCAKLNSSIATQRISFCTIDYPTCVKNATASDLQAQSYSEKLLYFVDNEGCRTSRKNYACAVFFPKCVPDNNEDALSPIMEPVCRSTCEAWLDSCQFTSPECESFVIVGPGDNCTSNANSFFPTVSTISFGIFNIILFFLGIY